MDRQQQLEKDIATLKKLQGPKFIIVYTLAVLLLGFLIEWLFEWAIDKISFSRYLASYRWSKLVWMAAWWLAFAYFFITKQNQRQLRKKEEELAQLRTKQDNKHF